MLLGNEQAQDILSRYFARIKESDEITFPFLLLAGPQHVGKRYMIEPMVHDLVGMYGQTDYLPLYDLSYVTGKKHSVKIQVSEKDQRIEIEGKQYRDLGARDIVQRLSLSPVGKHKVLFIQNIERMTTQAANALLKTREEPLPGRLLIASTSHKDSLLDTILSRACVVQFQSVTTDAMENFLTSWYTDKTEEQRLFAASFAGGCPGAAIRLLAKEDEGLAQDFHRLLHVFDEENQVTARFALLQKLSEAVGAGALLDAVLYTQLSREGTCNTLRLHARDMLRSNVQEQMILFSLAVNG